ncbi:hypothetical protein [uncultured Mediterranean phage uvMED]|nr:hypothetical protein [uncultured Mediterranean phage uvMED]
MALNFANNNSLSAITSLPASISGGGMTLISTQTASSSSTISFTSGIDSTYDEYVFKFYDIHPATDGASFQFNMSIDGGSNYNVTKTTTYFTAYNYESGGTPALTYATNVDLAQSTAFQNVNSGVGSDNDQCAVGTLHLFNPSSTTFVKHFLTCGNTYESSDLSSNVFVGGYGNTTSAVDAVQFKMSSGNIDSGVIKLYGVS